MAVDELLDVCHLHPAEPPAAGVDTGVRGVEADRAGAALNLATGFPHRRVHPAHVIEPGPARGTGVPPGQLALEVLHVLVEEGSEALGVGHHALAGADIDDGHRAVLLASSIEHCSLK